MTTLHECKCFEGKVSHTECVWSRRRSINYGLQATSCWTPLFGTMSWPLTNDPWLLLCHNGRPECWDRDPWPTRPYYLALYVKSLLIPRLEWWIIHQSLLYKTRLWIKIILSPFYHSSLKTQYLRLSVGPKTAQPSTWKRSRNRSRWQPCRSEQMPIFLLPMRQMALKEGRRISPWERILCAALILEIHPDPSGQKGFLRSTFAIWICLIFRRGTLSTKARTSHICSLSECQ